MALTESEVNVTADELLIIIRRDIGGQVQNALQFKMGNHLAANMRVAGEAAKEITDWIDGLTRDNQLADYKDGLYRGTVDDWTDRAYRAENKLSDIMEILKK